MSEDSGQLILLTPQGQTWNQQSVEGLVEAQKRYILLCGRYEGFDQRVIDILEPLEISVGDFILNGGEVAAMVLVDSLVRMVPGVLGDDMSNWDDSFSRGNRLLEYPQYTRPREFEGRAVPPVLLGGNHQEIERWRQQKSLENTRSRRSDLLADRSFQALAPIALLKALGDAYLVGLSCSSKLPCSTSLKMNVPQLQQVLFPHSLVSPAESSHALRIPGGSASLVPRPM